MTIKLRTIVWWLLLLLVALAILYMLYTMAIFASQPTMPAWTMHFVLPWPFGILSDLLAAFGPFALVRLRAQRVRVQVQAQ